MTNHFRIADAGPEAQSAIPDRRLADVLQGPKSVERLIRAGQSLFHQGDEARHVYEVRSGVLRQSRDLETGERQVIGFHFPGDFVGFCPDGTHLTGLTAITNGRAWLHRVDALTQPDRDLSLHDRLMTAALQEIGFVQDQLVMLGRRSARAKVEAFVQYLVERTGTWRDGQVSVDIPMSRYDIADFLGLAVETVSRSFSELRSAGVIGMEDAHRLTVLSPAALANVH